MVVTVLTPTYNRRDKIKVLYDSLCCQTSKNFEWLIVDDGSNDNTQGLIEQLQFKSDFPIRYIYKNNGGKHTALNEGIRTIKNELTFIVDSDDFLTSDAIASILDIHRRYKNRSNLCGYAFLRSFPDGQINGMKFKKNEEIISYIEARINRNDTNADKAEVFFTRCLKEFPFPEYPGEKFLGEDLVWIRMARKYKMVHVNKAIYVGNYIEDGLTTNRRKHNIASPIGCMHRAEEFIKPDIRMKYRIKGGLQYIVYGKFAGYSIGKLIKKTKFRGVVTVCALPGMIIYQKWKKDTVIYKSACR
ncbi:glycosyltransferase family 2 protein [Drancourtella massiliensis]|uniref:Glycosyltransferase family 2 protein n=1 Tax=Drancourtella massiliensis TaxID=1632013 RepID=A0ABS2EHD7_9FIRM|nr:glycosyltransferase family A protein [Drancourtella massiliensis]MBM6744349.1 glycosyltransferase family 2 protein [Drancourtella massiliensis]